MKTIQVSSIALNQTSLDWEGNEWRIKTAIRDATEAGADIVCLPELCITGYGCEDAFFSNAVVERAGRIANDLAGLSKGMLVAFGLPVLHGGKRYNGMAVAVDGKLRGIVLKQFLADDGIHYEPRWFRPWARDRVDLLDIQGTSIPIGDISFIVNGLSVGFEICRDAWVDDRPAKKLAQLGIDIILNPSASHFAFGKHEIRKQIVREGSQMCSVGYVYANLLGCESGRAIYDGDTMIASKGELVACGPRFEFADKTITTAQLIVPTSKKARDVCDSESNHYVFVEDFVPLKKRGSDSHTEHIQTSRADKKIEFEQAVTLALFDYARKSKSCGFVVSLSGGVDSSAASYLIARMIQRGTDQLGLAGFQEKFRYVASLGAAESVEDITRQMLTCVYQATDNSSKETRMAAKSLAENLGASWHDVNVQSLVDGYRQLVEGALDVSLEWKDHDTLLQNIQARVRSPSVWMIANFKQALLVATSNRSEASVGYTTMDGDCSGGLAPLGGIDKAFLREWLAWIEKHDEKVRPALSLVNAKAPTAELRPLSAQQTDEDDLMPYVVLDAIERYAVRDHLDPLAVYQRMILKFERLYSKKDIVRWIERFFSLWCRNQWKRERYAVSFHLDDENVDPKTFCRFPVLSGGYEYELKELRAILMNES